MKKLISLLLAIAFSASVSAQINAQTLVKPLQGGTGTSVASATTGAPLTWDGTNFVTTQGVTAPNFAPNSSTVPTNGVYLPSTNTLGFATNGAINSFLDANGFYAGTFSYTSGTQTVFALTSGVSQLYLVYSVPQNYGAVDDRHGILNLVGNNTANRPTNVAVAASTATGTFSLSGLNLQYSGGGGSPATTIRWIRLF